MTIVSVSFPTWFGEAVLIAMLITVVANTIIRFMNWRLNRLRFSEPTTFFPHSKDNRRER